jgi:hypothetical protein
VSRPPELDCQAKTLSKCRVVVFHIIYKEKQP